MALTVLNVAYPFAAVGPRCVGGAEQIFTGLDQALTAGGHNSLVMAREDSTTAGRLIPLPPTPHPSDRGEAGAWRASQAQLILDRVVRSRHIDLIHAHDMHFYQYRWPHRIPVLVTLHLPPSWYPPGIWSGLPQNMRVQCVSETQRRSCPAVLRHAQVISNGVEPSTYRTSREEFAIVLGRICPEKNQHAALEAGFLANIRVVLGGEVFPWPEHVQYFEERIRPLLQQERYGIQHRFCGPLDTLTKHRLLATARCLLHPTLAPETSSLVAMEALAAGTPVITYRSGALPEIVEDGITGFIVDNVEQMAASIHRVDAILPETCRYAAAQRFSKRRMIREYLNLYSLLTRSQERRYA